jgi:saccharopine dehydrogenase-like NADP-dependent oxidoreductase
MKRKILLFGAGRSSSSLVEYLLDNSEKENWDTTLITNDLSTTTKILQETNQVNIYEGEVTDQDFISRKIKIADIVISMLPARFHMHVAKECLNYGKNLITASYISEEMRNLNDAAKEKGLLFLNECGLDPGLDHMSAMRIIHEIQNEGGQLLGFESFTGGLVAPQSDNNPWNYKFTWNPRNVVLAGQGGAAMFIQEDTYKYIPYQKLFRRTEIIEVERYGRFEGYANRDSLKYRSLYGLENISTLFRGTLRKPGFCKAWDCLIQLGMTDDTYQIENLEGMTNRQFTNLFLKFNPNDSVEIKLKAYLGIRQDDFKLIEQLEFIGLFEDTKIRLKSATPAQVLQSILEKKWTLSPNDKDMIVMWHQFKYKINGVIKHKQASMVVIGEDQEKTAMAITVGLPIGIATKLILNKEITQTGVLLPLEPGIYNPILNELENEYQIKFEEKNISK